MRLGFKQRIKQACQVICKSWITLQLCVDARAVNAVMVSLVRTVQQDLSPDSPASD